MVLLRARPAEAVIDVRNLEDSNFRSDRVSRTPGRGVEPLFMADSGKSRGDTERVFLTPALCFAPLFKAVNGCDRKVLRCLSQSLVLRHIAKTRKSMYSQRLKS